MAPLVPTPEERNQLEAVVHAELARRGWKLADEPAFFTTRQSFYDLVQERVREWGIERQLPRSDDMIRKATIHEYCYLLHAAFQRNGARIEMIAMEESYQYTWPLIINKCGDNEMAQNVLMQALSIAWRKIDGCKPGTFLAWFVKIAINVLWREMKRDNRLAEMERTETDLSVSTDGDPDEISPFELLVNGVSKGQNEIDQLLNELSQTTLFDKLRGCLNNLLQLSILIAYFFLDLNISEIAHMLKIKAAEVSTNKFQALAKIRNNCPMVVAELYNLLS